MTQALIPGGPTDPYSLSDHELGQRIGALIASQGGSDFSPTPILSLIQDLLGADTTLLGPLRDLLVRPSFRRLVGEPRSSVLLGGRDALLQDLSGTYNPAMLTRLTIVIDGCLGLPPGTQPPSSQPGGYGQPYNPGWSQNDAPPPGSMPPPGPGPYGQPQGYSPPPAPSASVGGSNLLTALLIVMVSLLAGALLIGLGWLLLSNQRQLSPQGSASPTTTKASSGSSPPPGTDKGSLSTSSPPSDAGTNSNGGAWGDASSYKFGRLPGGDYPNSCAFSQTDSQGKIATDKTSMEYWACRDVGGDPERGYNVVWADGKQTTYTFAQGGTGAVVGTNGSTYPMRWQNDTHMGSDIIVINHQDGAQSWIPGHIRDPQD